jgi:hypothetical protein
MKVVADERPPKTFRTSRVAEILLVVKLDFSISRDEDSWNDEE